MPQVEFFAVASPADVVTFCAAFLDARGGECPDWTTFAASESPAGEPAILRTLALRPNPVETARPFLLDVIRRCAPGVLVGDPLAIDIAWSWIDAWLNHSSSPEHFAEAFDIEGVREAFRTPFLLPELARSVAVGVNAERTVFYLGAAMQRLVSTNPLSDSSAKALGTSIGRIVYGAAPNLVTSPIGLVLVDACMSAGSTAYEAYLTESEVCEFLLDAEQRTQQLDAQSPLHASTAIAIADLNAEGARRAASADWSEPAEARHKRIFSLVQRRLTAVAEGETWTLLDELASDSDCFIRCAAITHALALAGATTSASTKATAHITRARAQSCVMRALSDSDHHWLRGALIAAHLDASQSIEASETDGWSLPPLGSFDLKKFMLTPLGERSAGLAAQLLRFASCRSRVALVLPSIETDVTTTAEQEGRQNNKGSPPLGLGQIATYLSARGHYVHLYDAHRFRFDEDSFAAELAAFDVVGLSLVFSTIRSGQSLTRKIRSHGSAARPLLIVGGHAPTLMTAERMQQANIQFDYLVIGPGEEAFAHILSEARTERAMKVPRVVTGLTSAPLSEAPYSNNRELAKARSATTKRYQNFLEHLPWIDRVLFADPVSGEPYEPSPTRNGKDVEAHLVLSRGCDWRCSFCTEALIAGREGENRRSVADILGEIEHLARLRAVTRIQFIDDNVFPTLPASKRRSVDEVAKARMWAEDLLAALSQLATEDRQRLKWRGLMRLEDFLRYEQLVPGFVHRLAQSGCNLLAFGLECGSEAARAKMKGVDERPATNDEIIALVSRLHAAGIFVKGYFIIGGPGQGRADAEDTIAFAVASNLDLAYFAIYKDFRGIAQSTGKDDQDDDAALRFRLFAATTLDTASNWSDDDVWEEKFGAGIAKEDRRTHALALADLQRAGFSFGDLVRYNDYHEWIEPYTKMGFHNHDDYLRTLSEAYLRFYARAEWLPRYRALVGSGY